MSPEERSIQAESDEHAGTVCGIVSLLSLLCGLTMVVTGRWAGLWLLAVGAMLLATAHWSWARADEMRTFDDLLRDKP